MVGVESGLYGPSVETGLGKYVTGELGGEMTIIFGSVETAELEGPKDCKSASRFEKIAKMLSWEEQFSVVSAVEFDVSGIISSNQTLLHLAKNKKKHLAAINMWTWSR